HRLTLQRNGVFIKRSYVWLCGERVNTSRQKVEQPVSIVLVTFQEKGGTPTVRVVTGHAVQEVEVLQEGNEETAGQLRVIFTPPGAHALGPEEVRHRKERLRLWLEKNRIPVEEKGEMLCVANVLTVSAPYGAEDCSSSNEIILARVQSLVESNPDSTPDQPAIS
uniref:AD domain-containing protein n=1 Tax=Oncorhynchus tshawytscha TaxID=74940 RepID=A0AAZ3QF64_ONCTS